MNIKMPNARIYLLMVLGILVLGGCGRTSPPLVPFTPDFEEMVERGEIEIVGMTVLADGSAVLNASSRSGFEPAKFIVEANREQALHLPRTLIGQQIDFSVVPVRPQESNMALPLIISLILLAGLATLGYFLWLLLRLTCAGETISRNTKPNGSRE